MLSRTVAITRTAGEDRETRAHARGRSRNGPVARGGTVGRVALLVVVAALLAVFAFLNRDAVVAGQVDFLFAAFDRPSLLAVLFLTSVVSAAGALVARSAFHEFVQRRDLRDRRLAEPVRPPPLMVKAPATAGAV
jgi:uncharacterized integral membrane protein